MSLENVTFVLGWTTVLNYLVLLLWFFVHIFGSDKIYQLHTRWFTLGLVDLSSPPLLATIFVSGTAESTPCSLPT